MGGCELQFVLDRARIDQLMEQVLLANAAQVGDPAFAAELRSRIRFSASSALAHRDGLYSACSGNPGLPDFVGRRVFGQVFTPKAMNARHRRQIRSSAVRDGRGGVCLPDVGRSRNGTVAERATTDSGA